MGDTLHQKLYFLSPDTSLRSSKIINYHLSTNILEWLWHFMLKSIPSRISEKCKIMFFGWWNIMQVFLYDSMTNQSMTKTLRSWKVIQSTSQYLIFESRIGEVYFLPPVAMTIRCKINIRSLILIYETAKDAKINFLINDIRDNFCRLQ